MTQFYHVSQNNSGGRFTLTEGLTHHVIIEAESAQMANDILEGLGGYFYGVDEGPDCECCGDRWSRVSEYDAEPFPHIYGEEIVNHSLHIGFKFMPEDREAIIHYLNGISVWVKESKAV